MKEHEIRPEALLDRYLELSAQDVEHCFGGGPRTKVPCVACGSGQSTHRFAKNGFAYAQCADCGTFINYLENIYEPT